MDKQKIMEKSLNMDELEQVSGGSDAECMDDMAKFLSLTRITPYVGSRPNSVTPALVSGLEAAFSMFGVEVKLRKNNRPGCNIYNRYYIKGKLVSRGDAWAHIMRQNPQNLGTSLFNPQD